MTKNNWSDGDSVTATQLNRMEDQLVIQCTSGTRPTGVEGQKIYETDTNRVYLYSSSVWRCIFSEWESFTPSWTNLTVGNGTNTGAFAWGDQGLLVAFQFTFGSTSSISGNVSLDIPDSATARSGPASIGVAIYDDGGSEYSGTLRANGGASSILLFATGNVNSTNPFTWATGDVIHGSILIR